MTHSTWIQKVKVRLRKMQAVIDDEHRDLRYTVLCQDEKDFYINAPTDLARAIQEIERLQAALKKYGKHPDSCHEWCNPGHITCPGCTCGLDAALTGEGEG